MKGGATTSFVTKTQRQIKQSACDTTVKYNIYLLMPIRINYKYSD
ncbi:hypothetical protein FVB9532_00563 [Mesonia oceanica]|uniref:Uncharacterized protein n=1 Tax=Mesonia oceanica TaxID=2687242 RepID=A0AC61Y4A4_9FLAO|nr:hypothetical protein FVB9532_00563 [Mesonia oceanica]